MKEKPMTDEILKSQTEKQERLYALWCFGNFMLELREIGRVPPDAFSEAIVLAANRTTGMSFDDMLMVFGSKSNEMSRWVEAFTIPPSPFVDEEVIFGSDDESPNEWRRAIAVENQKWIFSLTGFSLSLSPPDEVHSALRRWGRRLGWSEVRFGEEYINGGDAMLKLNHFADSVSGEQE
jgi:hypothetical protein